MTLPSSGPLSLSQIAGEFGGQAPHALSEYYGAAPGVPASGPIGVSQFYGTAGERKQQVWNGVGAIDFVVPAGVTSILFKMWGAGGGGGGGYVVGQEGGFGGPGCYLGARLAVTPGETLQIIAGTGGQTAGHYRPGGGGGNCIVNRAGGTLLAAGSGGGGGGNEASTPGGSGGRGGTPLNVLTPAEQAWPGGDGNPVDTGGGVSIDNTAGGAGGSNGGAAGMYQLGGNGGPSTDAVSGGDPGGGNGGSDNGHGGGGGGGHWGGGGGGGAGQHMGAGGGGGSTTWGAGTSEVLVIASATLSAPNSTDPDYIAGCGTGGDRGNGIAEPAAGGNALVVAYHR